MLFIFVQITILVVILFLVIILSMVWPPDSPWAPWWRTNKKVAIAFCKLSKITSKDTVYELGSGDGEVLLTATAYGAKGVGIEIDPIRLFISSVRVLLRGKSKEVVIKRNNFFKEDISKASVVFVYLVPKTLNKLIPKFKKELKKDTRIVSFRYEMNLKLVKYDKKHDLRLYSI